MFNFGGMLIGLGLIIVFAVGYIWYQWYKNNGGRD